MQKSLTRSLSKLKLRSEPVLPLCSPPLPALRDPKPSGSQKPQTRSLKTLKNLQKLTQQKTSSLAGQHSKFFDRL